MAAHALKVISGPAAGESLEIQHEIVIGREGVDLEIDDPEMSRRHTALRPVEGGVEIEDLGSLNGTFVAGERIEGRVTLDAEAEIRLGQTRIEVLVAHAEPAAEEPAAQEPIASPDVTAPRQIPQPDVTAPRRVPEPPPDEPIPQPDVTAPRQIPQPDVTAPRQIPQPDVTAPRRVPEPAPPAEEPVASPDVTAPRQIPQPEPAAAARRVPPAVFLLAGILVGAAIAVLLVVLLS